MMFIELALAILLGVFTGIFSGITPGIHINLVSVLVVSASAFLLGFVSPLSLCCFIVAMAITHTFLDTLPSIYLGAPDSSEVLNVLPGHRLLLKGLGHAAVIYTILGSFGALLLSVILFPLMTWSMKLLDPIISDYIGVGLVVLTGYLILREHGWQKKFRAFLMFTLSGILGVIVLNLPFLKQPLFPLLSGLFGLSILLTSIAEKSTIPKQDLNPTLILSNKNAAKAIGASTGVGYLAAFLPGFGSSQAAILATAVVKDIGDEGFLCLVGGINTANMLISLATVYMLDKARNGAIVAMGELIPDINLSSLLILLCVSLVAGGLATFLTLKLSKSFSKLITKVNYKKLIITIISFILILAFLFDGLAGLLVLATATSLGLVATALGVGKNHLMGCLILPVIFFFVL